MFNRCSKVERLNIDNFKAYILSDKYLNIDILNDALGSISVNKLDVGNVANFNEKIQ